MRKRREFIDSEETGVQTLEDARKYCPWAAEIRETENGFVAFRNGPRKLDSAISASSG